jgi:hypothetical protein
MNKDSKMLHNTYWYIHAQRKENGKQRILHIVADTLNKNDYLIAWGDFSAHTSNNPIEDILGTNGETVLNENGKMLINFAVFILTNMNESRWHRERERDTNIL